MTSSLGHPRCVVSTLNMNISGISYFSLANSVTKCDGDSGDRLYDGLAGGGDDTAEYISSCVTDGDGYMASAAARRGEAAVGASV